MGYPQIPWGRSKTVKLWNRQLSHYSTQDLLYSEQRKAFVGEKGLIYIEFTGRGMDDHGHMALHGSH